MTPKDDTPNNEPCPSIYLDLLDINQSLLNAVKALLMGLMTDGVHHKQYYLEQAFRALCEDNYVNFAKDKFGWDEGIAP